MPLYPELYILRHGETLWTQQGRFQGQKDSPLTDKGRRQAMAQGEFCDLLNAYRALRSLTLWEEL